MVLLVDNARQQIEIDLSLVYSCHLNLFVLTFSCNVVALLCRNNSSRAGSGEAGAGRGGKLKTRSIHTGDAISSRRQNRCYKQHRKRHKTPETLLPIPRFRRISTLHSSSCPPQSTLFASFPPFPSFSSAFRSAQHPRSKGPLRWLDDKREGEERRSKTRERRWFPFQFESIRLQSAILSWKFWISMMRTLRRRNEYERRKEGERRRRKIEMEERNGEVQEGK